MSRRPGSQEEVIGGRTRVQRDGWRSTTLRARSPSSPATSRGCRGGRDGGWQETSGGHDEVSFATRAYIKTGTYTVEQFNGTSFSRIALSRADCWPCKVTVSRSLSCLSRNQISNIRNASPSAVVCLLQNAVRPSTSKTHRSISFVAIIRRTRGTGNARRSR